MSFVEKSYDWDTKQLCDDVFEERGTIHEKFVVQPLHVKIIELSSD